MMFYGNTRHNIARPCLIFRHVEHMIKAGTIESSVCPWGAIKRLAVKDLGEIEHFFCFLLP